jgi:predicted nucleotidyltransferase
MTLLAQLGQERRERRERLRVETLQRLRALLGDLVPGQRVIVFGSLLQPGRFSETSDVDLALDAEPSGLSIYQLTSLLAERLGRSVDVLLLSESRFQDRILQEGEAWTLPA